MQRIIACSGSSRVLQMIAPFIVLPSLLLESGCKRGAPPAAAPSAQARSSNAYFIETFAAENGIVLTPYIVDGIGYEAIATLRPIVGQDDKLLVYVFNSSPRPGHPVMQLQVMARMPDGSPLGMDPFIMCSLNQSQADSIMRIGTPPSLITALVEAADNAGWDVAHPKLMDVRYIYVEASSYFPEK